MKFSILSAAINKLNTPVITFDWQYNALIMRGTKGNYHVALAAFETRKAAKFKLSVKITSLQKALQQLNPMQNPNLNIGFDITDIDEVRDREVVQMLNLYTDDNRRGVFLDADVIEMEQLKSFHLEDHELNCILDNIKPYLRKDGYEFKITNKTVAEITINKKTGSQTISIPKKNIEYCLGTSDQNLSICLLSDGNIRLAYTRTGKTAMGTKDGLVIVSEMTLQTVSATTLQINFTAQQWAKIEFAAKIASQFVVKSPIEEPLTGVEIQTGSNTTRIKGFSGKVVYSHQLTCKAGKHPQRILIPYQVVYEFARLREDSDKIISLYVKENNNEVILTSESAAIRAPLGDVEHYPSNWHQLPISRAVPALIDRQQFLQELTRVTEWARWDKPNATFVRLLWSQDRLLVLQGTKGLATLYPKNKGYSSDAPEVYVSANALRDTVEQLNTTKFRIALTNSESEMLRLSDETTEAGIAILHEPHYSGFKKKQTAQPDQLVELHMPSDEGFDCRAIEICPMSVEVPELGAIDSDEDPEEAAQAEMMDFVRTYQSYGLFAEKDAPAVSTIKQIYQLAIPEEFEKRRMKTFYGATDDFANYIFSLTVVAESLIDETFIQRLLSLDELSSTDVKNLRTAWQISLNREYWRGHNDALDKVKQLAKDRNLEGYEEVVADLKAQIPDDLKTLCDRLRIWIGRLQLSEQNLVPTMQTEFRPK
jgi:hypothetical protein